MNKQIRICVFAPEIHDTISQEIISGVLTRARTLGIDITIIAAGGVNRHDRSSNEDAVLYRKVLESVKFDGAIVMAGSFSNHATTKEVIDFLSFIPKDYPLVNLSLKIPGYSSLLVDNISPLEELVDHLINKHNKKRIMFIKGPDGQDEAEDRLQGYKNGLTKNNYEINDELIFKGNFSPHSGAEAVKKLIESGQELPDAIVCADDDTCLGVYSELKRLNIDIKSHNIAVTGFDNMDYTKSMDPSLTTVDQSFILQGEEAVNSLLTLIKVSKCEDNLYKPRVIYRDSCGCSVQNSDSDGYENSEKDYSDLIYYSIDEIEIDGLEEHINDITSNIYKFISDSSYRFTSVIEGYIDRYKYRGYNLKVISDIISQLTRRVVSKLGKDELLLYMEQVDYINNKIIDTITKEKVREYRSFNEQSSELDAILMQLATCMSYNELLEALEKNFFYLGIKSMSLVFPSTENQMLKNISLKVFEKDDSLNRSRKDYCTLYLPIFYQYDFGYCKVKILLNSFHIAEVIAFQISRALYLITLFNNLNEKIFELETSYRDLRATKELLLESEQLANLGGLVAGFTHEINSPIGVGVTATSHLQEQVENIKKSFEGNLIKKSDLENFIKTADESVEIIMSNLNRTASLIHGFKQIAVDQASEILRSFEVGSYLKDVIHSLTPIFKPTSHIVKIDVPESIFIESYPGAISQIITNLIQNSIKHGFENIKNGVIYISAERKNNNILIRFKDNGCGVGNDVVDKIFESYYSTKIGSGGSGLGLAIVKQLIEEKLNGSIRCVSTKGEGLEFFIEFPLILEKEL